MICCREAALHGRHSSEVKERSSREPSNRIPVTRSQVARPNLDHLKRGRAGTGTSTIKIDDSTSAPLPADELLHHAQRAGIAADAERAAAHDLDQFRVRCEIAHETVDFRLTSEQLDD